MADILSMTKPDVPTVPTLEDVEKTLHFLIASTLIGYQQHGVNGMTINSIGTVLSKITFDGKQTKAEIQAIVHEAALKELELVKVAMLRDTVVSGITIN